MARAADAGVRSVVESIGKVGLSRASVGPAEERDTWPTRRFNNPKTCGNNFHDERRSANKLDGKQRKRFPLLTADEGIRS